MNKHSLLFCSVTGILIVVGAIFFSITRWGTPDDDRPEQSLEDRSPSPPFAPMTVTPSAEATGSGGTGIVPTEEQPAETESRSAPMIDEAQAFVADLEELGLMTLRILGASGELSQEVQEFFDLNEEGVERLNLAFREAADSLRELELQQMEVALTAPDQALVRINPLGDQTHGLKEELRQTLFAELGDTDGKLLWDLVNLSPVNRPFWTDFGEGGVEFKIKLTEQGSGIGWA